MEWVAVNRIQADSADEVERIVEAFRHRSGKVDLQPGFKSFELWRLASGPEVMVVTRWTTKASFEAWVESPAFRHAHANAAGAPGRSDGSVYEIVLSSSDGLR